MKLQKELGDFPTSDYRGVLWDRRIRRWRAQFKDQYLGLYEDDRSAAEVVNYQCDQNSVERLNPSVGTKAPAYRKMKKRRKKKQSVYRGVTWNEKHETWTAQVTYEHVRFNLGDFETELEAGKAVNGMCDELGIKRRNKNLGI